MSLSKVWKFGDDVDTDQIIASQYIILPGIGEMKAHAFETLEPGFAAAVQPGDVIVAGENFGCGSSREQAPAVLRALGVRAVVAKSVARIFFRNAVNIGLPVVLCDGVQAAVNTGDALDVDLAAGTLRAGAQTFTATRLPAHMQAILAAGGLLESLKGGAGEGAAPTAVAPQAEAGKAEKPVQSGPPAARSGSGAPLPGRPSPAAGSGCLPAPQASQPSAHSAPMTMAEKIIAAAAGLPAVRAGEIHTIALDGLMTNDGTTHLTLGMLRELQRENPAIDLADPSKLVFVIDHNSPADTPKTAEAHRAMRDYAREKGIPFYEGKGVCHQLMVENHVTPGQFVIGADSHTCTYGALGAFGTGVGCTDFLYGMVTGTTWVLVPETLRFHLHGRLRAGVEPRDLMLTILGDIGAAGANYKVMEFTGEGLAHLELDQRLVLANLAVEAGAKTALMAPDEKVQAYIKERGRSPKAIFTSDEGAAFAGEYHYDLDKIEPVVARPHRIDDVGPIGRGRLDRAAGKLPSPRPAKPPEGRCAPPGGSRSEHLAPAAERWDGAEPQEPAQAGEAWVDPAGTPIHEAFLGSCSGGRIGELRTAARLLKGRRVAPGVRFIVSPASNAVYEQALEEGLIQTLNGAGAMVVNANCSVCWGSCQGVLGPGEVLISTGTRNFKGRAGSAESFVYLAGAATVTASAIQGAIATEDML